jgi:hypothetical protein
VSDELVLSRRVSQAAELVRAHSAGDANAALLGWIEAASQLYKQELVYIEPARLLAVQAQLQQLEALAKLAGGALQTNGCI